MAIQNILPDPYNTITNSGDSGGEVTGPGFASMSLSSAQPIMRDRTNSGRLISRSHAYHKWQIDITYNPLTKAEFDPVYNFLLHKQGSLKPFYVSLPQYRVQGIADKTTTSSAVAGSTTLACNTTGIVPGALFRINDSGDSSHTKAYMVTRVGASSITIIPGLAKSVTSGAVVDFTDPTVKVIQTQDVQSYNLANNNLYSFSLKLEEVSQ
jgi:hypothetical protein